jgi:hypothetical protein
MSIDAIANYYPHLENSDVEPEMFYLLRLYSLWGDDLSPED